MHRTGRTERKDGNEVAGTKAATRFNLSAGDGAGRKVGGIFTIGKVGKDKSGAAIIRVYGTGAAGADGTKVPTVGIVGTGKVRGSVTLTAAESAATLLSVTGSADVPVGSKAWADWCGKVHAAAESRRVTVLSLPAVTEPERRRGRKASTVKVAADDAATLAAIGAVLR
jgi:hypothetical protein